MLKSGRKYSICLLLVWIQWREVSGSDVTITHNLGDNVRLACTTSSAHEKSWSHIPDGSKYPIQISQMDHLTREYTDTGRFQLDVDITTGKCDLLITNVNKRDAGIYFCKDQASERSFKLLIKQIQRPLKKSPVNTAVIRGHAARLNCSTSYGHPVYWMHTPVGSTEQLDVFVVGSLTKRYSHRYTIEKDSYIGQYDLVIPHVQTSDAGAFECIDDYGSGIKVSAELIVMESPPSCSSNTTSDGVLVENDCGLKPEVVTITCLTTYTGNVEPQLCLKQRDNTFHDVRNESFRISNDYMAEKASEFIIQPTLHWRNDRLLYEYTHLSQVLMKGVCHVPGLEIHYIFNLTMISINKFISADKIEQQITCVSNSSGPCSYKWIKPGTPDEVISRNQIENFKSGTYQCIIECRLRKTICSFASLPVTLDETPFNADQNDSTSNITIIFTTAIAVSIAWVIVVATIMKKKSKKKSWTSNTLKKMLLSRKKLQPQSNEFVDNDKLNYRRAHVKRSYVGNAKEVEPHKTREFHAANKEDIKKFDSENENVIEQCTPQEVRGLALLGDKIYVVRQNEKVIQVFEVNSFSFFRNIPVESLSKVRDMVSCSCCMCLFVADEDNSVVHRIHIPSAMHNKNPSKIIQHLRFQANPESLCSTFECRLIVTFSDSKKVSIFNDKDGKHIVDIELEKLPWHTIQVHEDRYVFSHRGGADGIPENEICLVDKTGNIHKTFHEDGDGKKCLDRPGRMVATSSGFIFVADYNNDRIVLLDSKLELVNENFVTGIKNPSRICLDEVFRKIYVAVDNEMKEICIYDICPDISSD